MLEKLISHLGKNRDTITAIVVVMLVFSKSTNSILDRVLPAAHQENAEKFATEQYVNTRLSDLDKLSSERHLAAVNAAVAVGAKVDSLSTTMTAQMEAFRASITILSNRLYELARTRRASYAIYQEASADPWSPTR